jgi:HlyD family secretion protein
MSKLKKSFMPRFLGALGALLAVAALAQLSRQTEFPQAQAAQRAPVSSPYSAIAKGRIDIKNGLLRLAAKREGAVQKVLVEEGDAVKAGQPLMQLEDQSARVAAELAKSELEQAKRTLPALEAKRAAAEREVARLQPLVSDNTVARQELDQAMDQVQLIKADIATANAAIDTATIKAKAADLEVDQHILRAPMDGQIMRIQSHTGDFVTPQNPVFLFAPNLPRVVVAELEERFIPDVKPGQAAEVILEADENQKFQAKVLRIGKMVGARTPSDDPHERQDDHVVECLLSVDAPRLLIGQRVIVRIMK